MDLITNPTRLRGSAMPRILANSRTLMMGHTIVDVGYVDIEGTPWPCIVLDNGTTLTVSSDDEGNHPGSLFIESVTEAGETLCRTHLS